MADMDDVPDVHAEKLQLDQQFDDKIWDLIDAFRDVRDSDLPASVRQNVQHFAEELDLFRKEEDERKETLQKKNVNVQHMVLNDAEEMKKQAAEDEEAIEKLQAEIQEIDLDNEKLEKEIADLISYIRDYKNEKDAAK
uniref:Mediator of RNA polymerase II transcription subunit 21 n=1 Tax=Steinernema glaseri TaxID=37863 RepID=A0A1I8AFR3_9BILA